MGYQTEYDINVRTKTGEPVDMKKIEALLEQTADYSFESGYNSEWFGLYGSTWYDHEEDMKIVSKELGDNYVFEVEGYGEERGDWWKKYFVNGKMAVYVLPITFPEFKEEDLE